MSASENTLRINARGVEYRAVGPDDPSQSSLTLDPAVISTGFEDDGQSNITDSGQGISQPPSNIEYKLTCSNADPSRTSSNNWINFCKTVDKPLTNGSQVYGVCTVWFGTALRYSTDLRFRFYRGIM